VKYRPTELKFWLIIIVNILVSKLTSFRCKLFYKKGNEFADKGLGMLHLKPVEGTKKTQILVRAETSLGNILLNVMLNNQVEYFRLFKSIIFCLFVDP
jgi:nuclear pore complex protein Nup50